MKTSAKELAIGGVFTALGVVFLCLGGIVPLAFYVCPILASASLFLVKEQCSVSIAWCCYAAISVLGVLLGPDKESALLFVFLGYYPLVKPRLDNIRRPLLRGLAKLALAAGSISAQYALLLLVFRLDALIKEFTSATPVMLGLTAVLGFILFFLYDLSLERLALFYHRRRRGKAEI